MKQAPLLSGPSKLPEPTPLICTFAPPNNQLDLINMKRNDLY